MTILRAYSSLIPQAMEMLRNAPEVFINKEFTGFQMDLYLVPQRFESVLVPCLNHDKFDHVTEINFTFPRENNCRVWNYWLSADTLKISHCSKHRALPGGNRTSLSVTQNNISSHSLSKKMIIEILTSRWWSHKWQKLLVRHNKNVLVTKFYDILRYHTHPETWRLGCAQSGCGCQWGKPHDYCQVASEASVFWTPECSRYGGTDHWAVIDTFVRRISPLRLYLLLTYDDLPVNIVHNFLGSLGSFHPGHLHQLAVITLYYFRID